MCQIFLHARLLQILMQVTVLLHFFSLAICKQLKGKGYYTAKESLQFAYNSKCIPEFSSRIAMFLL